MRREETSNIKEYLVTLGLHGMVGFHDPHKKRETCFSCIEKDSNLLHNEMETFTSSQALMSYNFEGTYCHICKKEIR
jgi:hypothetical protein